MPPFLHRHFERKREIFFVRGQAKVVREAGNGKHRMLHVTGDHGASCRWIYEGKQQTANEKDPSAALGMTKRGNASRPFLFNPEQKPISAPSRHLLPEEGGRSGMSSPSTPFPWKGDARRAGGWPKENESEANLHRYATSFQRKEGEAVKTIYSLPVEGGSQANESRAFWHCHSLSGAALYFYAPHHVHCIFSACSLIPVFQRSPL